MTEHSIDDHFFAAFADSWWHDDSVMKGLASFQKPRFEYFDRFIDTWKGKKVLDVGCGGGFTTEYLAARGASVSGVDPAPRLIDAARAHAEQQKLWIDYQVGSGERLPHPDAAFDIVTCVDVLEHVADPARTVREIARVLAPGGIFLYDTINRTFLARLTMIWMPEYVLKIVPKGAHTHADFIKPAEMRRYLRDAELTPLDKMRGLTILGQRKDGSLVMRRTWDTSATYLSAARKN
ncbi:3-demethylubiquinone-9 3-methyltransferase [Nocardia tenerifensis]|uniref:3-demethylubiquinone-9 3-methyltransferase n=1 Tax=Nocardia tenerifensis TaxID=228006 RepID=A0A318JSL0_9NOCA|nr:bifunctional 2-polyprenyl-6-hydroxyphenol methylase/3-demethylubiquinol 3-O-methyltransferase UbiG [Nocardia tenerifensis]PXX55555.1 3-demethylubiquinone-9 3-methyltransferase [Nocardia tenerifensis]